MRPSHCVQALVAGLALLITLLATPGALAVPDTAGTDTDSPVVHLISAPSRVTPTSPVSVDVNVTAGASVVPKGWRLQLTMQPRHLDSRAAVAGWSGTSLRGSVGTQISAISVDAPIAAGQSRRFRFAVPAGQIDASRWGPHGAAIVLLDEAGARRAVLRTYLVTDPGTPVTRTKITVMLPMVASQLDHTTGFASRSLLNEIADGGRLQGLLAAAAQPGVVPVIDPAILTLTPDPSKAPPAPEEPAEEALRSWRDQVKAALRRNPTNEVIGLDYADPDVAALAAAKHTDLLNEAKRLGTQTFTTASLNPRLDVAVPADGLADAATIADYVRQGRSTAVVLADTLQEPVSGTGWVTPNGRGTARFSDGQVPTLLADAQLGAELAATSDSTPEGGQAATQRLLADLAAIGAQDPGNSRQLVVLAPRDWTPNDASSQALRALTRGPWTAPGSIGNLIASGPQVAREEPRLSAAQRGAQLRSSGVEAVAQDFERADTVLSALTDPVFGADQQGRLAAGLVSDHWRGRPDEWATARTQYRNSVTELQNAIRVVPGSTITQVSRNVRLPVTVRNDTSSPATVRLQVTPQSNRLVVTRQVEVKVAGKSRAVAYVPVRGVGNGDTSVGITLLAPDGRALGEPATVRVNVRADWESMGTTTFGVIAALLVLAGLIRSIRRGTRGSRTTQKGR